MSDILISSTGYIYDEIDSGLNFLTGLVVDNILNTVLTDLYAKDFGTDIKQLPQTNVDSPTELKMKLMMIVDFVQNRIIAEQSLDPSTPEEMLSKIQIIDLYETKPPNPIWFLQLRVFSISGESLDVEANINKILK